jgi:hypothetical protein
LEVSELESNSAAKHIAKHILFEVRTKAANPSYIWQFKLVKKNPQVEGIALVQVSGVKTRSLMLRNSSADEQK